MACACKVKRGQVSSVKQVVKKSTIVASPRPIAKNVTSKRVVKRPI